MWSFAWVMMGWVMAFYELIYMGYIKQGIVHDT